MRAHVDALLRRSPVFGGQAGFARARCASLKPALGAALLGSADRGSSAVDKEAAEGWVLVVSGSASRPRFFGSVGRVEAGSVGWLGDPGAVGVVDGLRAVAQARFGE
jgi:hypothetical protein